MRNLAHNRRPTGSVPNVPANVELTPSHSLVRFFALAAGRMRASAHIGIDLLHTRPPEELFLFSGLCFDFSPDGSTVALAITRSRDAVTRAGSARRINPAVTDRPTVSGYFGLPGALRIVNVAVDQFKRRMRNG